MTYCRDRDLRRQLYMAYNTQAIKGDTSNVELVRQIVNLRLRIVQLLGYKDFAEVSGGLRFAPAPPNVSCVPAKRELVSVGPLPLYLSEGGQTPGHLISLLF